jgi:hypothetical protein
MFAGLWSRIALEDTDGDESLLESVREGKTGKAIAHYEDWEFASREVP